MTLICGFCEEPINPSIKRHTYMMIDGAAVPLHISDRWSVEGCDYRMRVQLREAQYERDHPEDL